MRKLDKKGSGEKSDLGGVLFKRIGSELIYNRKNTEQDLKKVINR